MQLINHHTAIAKPAPTAQRNRIEILDSLRGIALLGILLMNIPIFARPFGGDPTILGETGLNFHLWYGVDWIFEGTQHALFSLLFGAGVLLFMNSRSRQADGSTAMDLFLKRQLWLIVFALFDVYILLWHGDILFDYACLGLIVLAFRKLSPKSLLFAAGVCLLLMMARYNVDLYRDKMVVQKGVEVAAIDTTQVLITPEQKKDLAAFTGLQEQSGLQSRQKRAAETIQNVSGSHAALYKDRTDRYVQGLTGYLYFGLWDVLLFMFLGMAFYKLDIITGLASAKVYWYLMIVGLSVGLSVSYLRLETMIQYNFNWIAFLQEGGFSYYELGRVARALGLFGGIMLLYKSGLVKGFFALMKPVGQMAFTNYLMQSLICGLIFYGIGLGLYGKLERYEIYLVMGVVWLFQIIYSNLWMRYFRFGPMEWLWRSLTYWQKQPFRRGEQEPAVRTPVAV